MAKHTIKQCSMQQSTVHKLDVVDLLPAHKFIVFDVHFVEVQYLGPIPLNLSTTPLIRSFAILQAVLDAHNAVISTMKPGVCWVDMHM